jgi:hypothetical protein
MKTFDEAITALSGTGTDELEIAIRGMQRFESIGQEVVDHPVVRELCLAFVLAVSKGNITPLDAFCSVFANGVRIGMEMEKTET